MGQPDAENGAGLGIFDVDAPAVHLDGQTTKSETQAAAGARGGTVLVLELNETVENGVTHCGRNALSLIRDAELELSGVTPGRNADRTTLRRIAQGIVQEIFEHAPEQVLIDEDFYW